MTQVAVAEAIKVHRVTVSNWLRKDPRFRAELNRRLQERAAATAVRMQSLVEASLDVLEASIKRDHDPKVASQLLRFAGTQGYLGSPPAGPATFEEAALQIALEDERDQSTLRMVLAATEPTQSPDRLIDTLTQGAKSSSRGSQSTSQVRPAKTNGRGAEGQEKGSRT